MHIAHFTNTYKPNINGVSRSVSSFRKALTKIGHNVFVICQEAKDFEDQEPFIFRYPSINIPAFDYSLSVPVSIFMDKLLPTLKINVIHSNHPVGLGSTAVSKAKELNLPLVFTFHTQYAAYASFLPVGQKFISQKVFKAVIRYIKQCNHIITPTDSIRAMLIDTGISSKYVTTIPTGIDLAPYQEADGRAIRAKFQLGNDPLLITIGRLSPEKNFKTLFEATAQVIANHPKLHLMVLGDGPGRHEIEASVEELGISDSVIFTGLVPFDQVPEYQKAADVFVFASVTETQGLVTMEAMAAGLPVVAVSAPGTKDIIVQNENGLLTGNDPDELAQAINRALSEPALLARFRSRAQRTARDFDISVQAEKTIQAYEQAIATKESGNTVEVDQILVDEQFKLLPVLEDV
jgi:glycosyltransferase involved in cell wall biosynthesis